MNGLFLKGSPSQIMDLYPSPPKKKILKKYKKMIKGKLNQKKKNFLSISQNNPGVAYGTK